MNKRPFLILFLFLLLFSFGGQAADTYRPETSIRDGDSAKAISGGRKL